MDLRTKVLSGSILICQQHQGSSLSTFSDVSAIYKCNRSCFIGGLNNFAFCTIISSCLFGTTDWFNSHIFGKFYLIIWFIKPWGAIYLCKFLFEFIRDATEPRNSLHLLFLFKLITKISHYIYVEVLLYLLWKIMRTVYLTFFKKKKQKKTLKEMLLSLPALLGAIYLPFKKKRKKGLVFFFFK